MKTFEQYLRENHERDVIDHALRCNVEDDGTVTFYIHPLGTDGDTLDFEIRGNVLNHNPRIIKDNLQDKERI